MPRLINLKSNLGENEPSAPAAEKAMAPSTPPDDSVIAWIAPEFEYREKSKNWLLFAAVIAFALFLFALLTENILFALLVIIAFFALLSYGFKQPHEIKFAVTAKGVRIESTLYPYENLRSFWIFYQPPDIMILSIHSKKTVMPYIKIPLGNQNPVPVRRLLIKYLPEKRQQESLIDHLSRRLKF